MRRFVGIAGAVALAALLLSGCASGDSQAIDMCASELSDRLENASDANVSAWEGGSVDDGVFVYTAILSIGGEQAEVVCEVVSSSTGFLLHNLNVGTP